MRDSVPIGVEAQHASGVLREHGLQALMGEEHGRVRVLQHAGEALAGIRRVQGNVGGAGLEDREQRDDEVERALQADPDEDAGASTEGAQVVRELVCA